MHDAAPRGLARDDSADAKARGCRVAVNGSDAADAPDLYLSAGADAVLLGETDRTLLELVERWERDPLADLSDISAASRSRRGPPRGVRRPP